MKRCNKFISRQVKHYTAKNDIFLKIKKIINNKINKNNIIKILIDKSSASINIDNESSENLSVEFESRANIIKRTDDIEQLDLLDKNFINLFLNCSNYNYN